MKERKDKTESLAYLVTGVLLVAVGGLAYKRFEASVRE